MSVNQFCRHDPVTAKPDETVREAAKRMASQNVGSLVVVNEKQRPVGMLTDRDIVQRVIRRRKDPDAIEVASVMSEDVVSVWQEVALDRAFHRMRQEGVRRVLVTDEVGRLTGILSYDDALPHIARRFALAAEVMSSQFPTAAGD